MERDAVPGMVVGVWHREVEEILALGVVDTETRWPTAPDVLFRCASITKVFTATTVMSQVDRGRVDLDAPVITYLPWLILGDADATARLTLRHCLSHTTGLWGHIEEDHGPGLDALGVFVRTFDRLPSLAPPGRYWGYANTGFAIAGSVIEAATGLSYEEAVQTAVLDPLGIRHATFSSADLVALPHAIGHERAPGLADPRRARDHHLVRNWNPSGGIWSTASDLLRLGRLLSGDGELDGQRVLSRESAVEMRTAQATGVSWADAWGLGLDIRSIGGVDVLGHGGAFGGFKSRLTFVPERDFAIVVLANASEADPAIEHVVRTALRELLGLEGANPIEVDVASADLDRCCGRYGSHWFDYLARRTVDGAIELVIGRPDHASEPVVKRLIPIGGRRFLVDDPDDYRIVAFLGDGERPDLLSSGALHRRIDA
jgi:CubicO group peptidase (beta-lactamase class C family)